MEQYSHTGHSKSKAKLTTCITREIFEVAKKTQTELHFSFMRTCSHIARVVKGELSLTYLDLAAHATRKNPSAAITCISNVVSYNRPQTETLTLWYSNMATENPPFSSMIFPLDCQFWSISQPY